MNEQYLATINLEYIFYYIYQAGQAVLNIGEYDFSGLKIFSFIVSVLLLAAISYLVVRIVKINKKSVIKKVEK